MNVCKNCGKELNGSRFCPNCGQEADGTVIPNTDSKVSKLVCPKCGSKRIQLVTETNVSTKGKNYSGAQGCLGYLMFGPLGMLCGSCGQSQKTTTTQNQYWVCNECGEKFKSPDEVRADVKKLEKLASVPFLIFIAVLVVLLVLAGVLSEMPTFTIFGVIYGIFLSILYLVIKFVRLPKEKEKLKELEEAMDRFR